MLKMVTMLLFCWNVSKIEENEKCIQNCSQWTWRKETAWEIWV